MPKPLKRSLQPFRLLLDEGAPISVGKIFEKNGYEVIYHSQVLPQGASDSRVASTAQLNQAVLIAVDNDMKRLSGRYGSGRTDERYKKLHLIKIACSEPMAAKRIEQAMSLIEMEWEFCCQKTARRFYFDVGPHYFRTFR